MRPPAADQAVAMLRRDVPEFEERFRRSSRALRRGSHRRGRSSWSWRTSSPALLVSCGAPGTLDRCFSVADEVVRTARRGRRARRLCPLQRDAARARALARPHLSTAMRPVAARTARGGEASRLSDASGGKPAWAQVLSDRRQCCFDGVDAAPAELAELCLGERVVEGREPQAEGERPPPLLHPRPR